MAKTNKARSIVKLYWVTTDDHDEDWFILARTSRTAESYHIRYEGYEPGDARAELILPAGTNTNPGPIPRHAQLEDLQTLGFEILRRPEWTLCSAERPHILEGHWNRWWPKCAMIPWRQLGAVGLGELFATVKTSGPGEGRNCARRQLAWRLRTGAC